jgi:3,4-dihydroxy 2-butanone 4-phosphate synthase/GTP cyclohydrolase II
LLSQGQDLLIKEEARPVANAVFSGSPLSVHFGFDQAKLAAIDWYTDMTHPYLGAIAKIFQQLSQWSDLTQIEFMVATGEDPMIGLQIQLDREFLDWDQLNSLITQQALKTQAIYHFQRENEA